MVHHVRRYVMSMLDAAKKFNVSFMLLRAGIFVPSTEFAAIKAFYNYVLSGII